MPEHDIAQPRTRRILRAWMSRLLPAMLFGVMVFTPLVIWLIKKPEPVFEQVRMGGRVAEVTPASDAGGHPLVTVELEDGQRVVVRGGRDLPPHGSRVTLTRTVFPDGAVSHELAAD